MSNAARIEETAARYLLRRQETGWSAADQTELDAWLAESTAHEVSYLRLEHGWRKADRIGALGSLVARHPPHPDPLPLKGEREITLRVWRWRGAIAAGLALVSLFAWYGGVFGGRTTYTTEIGGHQTVPLADGSRIELNTNSRVRTDVNDKIRTVWVERGEAYFDVVQDASRPFVVHAGERRITVLGTKFSVRRDADRVLVVVTEGRVQLDGPQAGAPSSPSIVKGGDTVVAEGSATRVESASAAKMAQELSWRQGILTFDQTTLAEAAAEFNRYNRKHLHIAESAAAVRIGGSFEATNIDAFVRLLEQGFNLKAAETGNTIQVSY